jgi:serine/threonine-protein phosphatase Stp1
MVMAHVDSAEFSDIGKKRKNNEDSYLRIPDAGVFCVADGMGGVVGGELASEAVTTSVRNAFTKAEIEQRGTLAKRVELFEQSVNQASQWIKSFADQKGVRGMGSTVVGFIMDPRNPSRAIGMHAGDSRLYRYRANELQLLTSDHTAAAALATALQRSEQSLPKKYQKKWSWSDVLWMYAAEICFFSVLMGCHGC